MFAELPKRTIQRHERKIAQSQRQQIKEVQKQTRIPVVNIKQPDRSKK